MKVLYLISERSLSNTVRYASVQELDNVAHIASSVVGKSVDMVLPVT